MAEMIEKIATREAYGNALAEFGDKYDFVVRRRHKDRRFQKEVPRPLF